MRAALLSTARRVCFAAAIVFACISIRILSSSLLLSSERISSSYARAATAITHVAEGRHFLEALIP